jgi:hypothetical protein
MGRCLAKHEYLFTSKLRGMVVDLLLLFINTDDGEKAHARLV